LIVHLSASTSLGPDPNAKVDVAEVEEAIRLGADGVSVHVNIGNGHTLTASLCNAATNMDTRITVFCGTCQALICVAGDDDSCTSPSYETASVTSWCSAVGVTYYIAVGMYSSTTTGPFQPALMATSRSAAPS
jgi:hypothetical protein